MPEGRLDDVWRVSQGFLESIYGMSRWSNGCLDVSEGQVRIGQVKIGQVKRIQGRKGQVRTG